MHANVVSPVQSDVTSPTGVSTSRTAQLSSFSVFNVHGLIPSTVPSKVPYVSDILKEQDQLFMGITETWLHNHKDGEMHVDGYKFFHADRKRVKKSARGRFSGGVGCYVRSDLACTMEFMINFFNGVV